MLKNLSLRNKIMLPVCLVVTAVLSATMCLMVDRVTNQSRLEGEELAREMAKGYGMEVKSQLEGALSASKTLSKVIEGTLQYPEHLRLDTLDLQLKEVLLSKPMFFGVWVYFEPNILPEDTLQTHSSFDSMPAPTDRPGSYVFRGEGQVQWLFEAIEQGEEADYYDLPKQQGTEVLTEPYYDLEAKQWMASACAPIYRNGVFTGVVGIDLVLDSFQALIENIHPFVSGYGYLLTNTGTLIAHPKQKAIGTSFADYVPEQSKARALESIRNGTPFSIIKKAMATGESSYQILSPVQIGTTTPWAFGIAIPTEKVLANAHALRNLALILSAGSIGLLIALIFFITRSLVRPIQTAADLAEGITRGDLSKRINIDSHDEIGRLAQALNTMTDNLQQEIMTAFNRLAEGDLTFEAQGVIREPLAKTNESLNRLMSKVQVAGRKIASSSSQVSDSSQSLSQGATEQAASLEEISSAMTEMESQTQQNADNAAQANSLAVQARKSAETGNLTMCEMIEAMGEIREASQSISKIIKTIDEIAFQTNLLALNAAVEAARAGQHGKGFAVVAEEVRNLAARSAQAASETAELIKASVSRIENGAQVADTTGEALSRIVSDVSRVSSLIEEIATASTEQAQGIAQVSQGLDQIDHVTQQNTADAEESAAAAMDLSTQANELHNMLRQFRLAGD